MTAAKHVAATLRMALMYSAIALFMIYTYHMFKFLHGNQSNLECSKNLHTDPAGIQPIWSPLSIVTNPLALSYLKCGLQEWYGYRPNHRIVRRLRSGASMRNGALVIANQLVVTRGSERNFGLFCAGLHRGLKILWTITPESHTRSL